MKITELQKKILEQITQGKLLKMIAADWGVSDSSLAQNLTRAKRENGAENTHQLIAIAFREGVLK